MIKLNGYGAVRIVLISRTKHTRTQNSADFSDFDQLVATEWEFMGE